MLPEDEESEKFLSDVVARLTGARIVLGQHKNIPSLVTEQEVTLETKHVSLPRNVVKVANYIQGHITSTYEPGDERITVICGIDKIKLNQDTVSFDLGFARDVKQAPVDLRQEARDTRKVAQAPNPEEFTVTEVADEPEKKAEDKK